MTDRTAEHDGLLQVDGLTVGFRRHRTRTTVVRGVDLRLGSGQALALLGESGSGKTVTAQTVMGLTDPRRAIIGGRIRFDGVDLVGLDRRTRLARIGPRMGMVFQDALSALNPVMTVGQQIAEVVRVHRHADAAQARQRSIELLDRVGVPAAAQRYDSYRHQLSGGLRQRVMIAIALALEPDLLIADEPTTALDVTVQAQLLRLLRQLCDESGLALLFITHDIAVASEIADRVAVMYAGRIVEDAPSTELHANPRHFYTAGLLDSVPAATPRHQRLTAITGTPPSPLAIPSGCAFHPRCPASRPPCPSDDPSLRVVADDHRSACHFAEQVAG